MSRNEAIGEALNRIADELDDQRREREEQHREVMDALSGIRAAIGHWVDDYNQNKPHVQEQFEREAEERRKVAARVGALELVAK